MEKYVLSKHGFESRMGLKAIHAARTAKPWKQGFSVPYAGTYCLLAIASTRVGSDARAQLVLAPVLPRNFRPPQTGDIDSAGTRTVAD